MLANEHLTTMALNSPTNNFLTRVYHQKTWLRDDMTKERALLNGSSCFISRDPKILPLFSSNDIFVVGGFVLQ